MEKIGSGIQTSFVVGNMQLVVEDAEIKGQEKHKVGQPI